LDSGRLSRFVRGERDINFDAASRLCDTLDVKFVLPRREPADRPAKPPRKRGEK
jgi:hypothetical protein